MEKGKVNIYKKIGENMKIAYLFLAIILMGIARADYNQIGINNDTTQNYNKLGIYRNTIGNYNVTGATTNNYYTNYTAQTMNCTGTDKFMGFDNNTGTFFCATDQTGGAGSVRLDQILNPAADTNFIMSNFGLNFTFTGANSKSIEVEGTGAFTNDLLHIHQHTGNVPAGTDLVHVEASDADAIGINVTTAGNNAIWTNKNITSSWFLGLIGWTNVSGRPTHLSNFTDNLGNRGYTNVLNFTNGAGYWNNTFATFNKTYADTLYAPTGWNPFNQVLNTTSNVSFNRITTSTTNYIDVSSATSWINFTGVGGFFQLGRLTYENGYFQFLPGDGIDLVMGNHLTSFFYLPTSGIPEIVGLNGIKLSHGTTMLANFSSSALNFWRPFVAYNISTFKENVTFDKNVSIAQNLNVSGNYYGLNFTNSKPTRALDTMYRNNNSYPIEVKVSIQSDVRATGDSAYVVLYANNTGLAQTGIIVWTGTDGTENTYDFFATMTVPSNLTYSVNSTVAGGGTVGLVYWVEERKG